MSTPNKHLNLTASAAAKTTSGVLHGFYVNSTSSGTIRFNDGSSGTPAAGTKATAVFTTTGTFSNGETVTVAGRTYTFVTTLTSAANQVLIGVSTAVTLDSLKAAVNGDAGSGSTYSYGTSPHRLVTATTNTDTAQTFEALAVGTYAHAYESTETCANASFGGAVFSGGVDTNLTMHNTITPSVGWHDLGDVEFTNGLYVTIANTINVTLSFR